MMNDKRYLKLLSWMFGLLLVAICATARVISIVRAPVILGAAAAAQFPLAGWGKRIKFTIDSNKVQLAQTDVPILLKISLSSGIGGTNLVSVFDEITSNSLKIAVTDSTETNQLFGEVEKWDYSTSNAWVWVKVPTVASGVDTVGYLYYDNSHADNSSFIGAVNSAVATNVWKPSYLGVWHLSDGGTGTRFDSTMRNNDGTPQNYDGSEAITGKIGGADALDGVDQFIDTANALAIDGGAFGISVWMKKPDALPPADKIFVGTGSYPGFYGQWRTTSKIQFRTSDGGSSFTQESGVIPEVTYLHLMLTRNATGDKGIYTNGVAAATGQNDSQEDASNGQTLDLGASWGQYYDIDVDEWRLFTHTIGSSEAALEFNSGNDSLITYGPEETP